MSHPVPGSDRVATLLVAVNLEATPLAMPAVVAVRAWEAVDSIVLVAEADAVVAEADGDKQDVEREKNDGVEAKRSAFAENHCDCFCHRCCRLRLLAGGARTEKGCRDGLSR